MKTNENFERMKERNIILPEVATSSTGLFCALAINPIILNTTKPANIDVPLLTHDMIRASLYKN